MKRTIVLFGVKLGNDVVESHWEEKAKFGNTVKRVKMGPVDGIGTGGVNWDQ